MSPPAAKGPGPAAASWPGQQHAINVGLASGRPLAVAARPAVARTDRGNRRVNHVIHMAAITQIRHKHSDGRAYYERKIAEGKTHKEALCCLKRRISDAIYARLRADARQAAACAKDPGGQPGNHSVSRAVGSHPARQLFGQATPGPQASLRATAVPTPAMPPEPPANKTRQATWVSPRSVDTSP